MRKYEKNQLKSFQRDTTNGTKQSDAWSWSEADDEDNIAWCKENGLNPSSMRSIKETIESTMNALYLGKHEPEWLRCSNPNPIWKRMKASELDSTSYLEKDTLSRIYGDEKVFSLSEALTKLALNRSAEEALPFVQEYFGLPSTNHSRSTRRTIAKGKEKMACVHFLMGNCKFGNECQNVHSFSAPRPLCRFYPNCSKGSSCVYSHGEPSVAKQSKGASTRNKSEPLVPVMKEFSLQRGVLGWFGREHKESIILGEGNFEFSNSLVGLGLRPFLATTDVLNPSPTGIYPKRTKARSMVGVDATSLHTNNDLIATIVNHTVVYGSSAINVVWNFPFITDEDENAAAHEILIRDTFQSVKLLFERIGAIHGKFCLGLQGDQFSRWDVLKSAWAIGWKLDAWDTYCYDDFPGYVPRRLNGEAFPVGSTRFYIFKHDER